MTNTRNRVTIRNIGEVNKRPKKLTRKSIIGLKTILYTEFLIFPVLHYFIQITQILHCQLFPVEMLLCIFITILTLLFD